MKKLGILKIIECIIKDDNIFNGDNLYQSPEGKIFKNSYDSPLEILSEGHKWIEPIIICDDEIKLGDFVLSSINTIFKIANKEWEFHLKVRSYNNLKKILVQSNQLSPDFIQLIIDGKIKDGDKVEVEMENPLMSCNVATNGNYEGSCPICHDYAHWMGTGGMHCHKCTILKLENKFAIIHPYKESVEGAASKEANKFLYQKGTYSEGEIRRIKYDAFIAGAKWQEQQNNK